MTRRLIEQLFKDRRVAHDPEEGGYMQIFRTPILKSESEAGELHAIDLFLALFYGVPMLQTEPYPWRTMAGMIFLAVQEGKLPHRHHINQLSNRWFKVVPGGLKDVAVDNLSYDPVSRHPDEFVTECCLVVDEWSDRFQFNRQPEKAVRAPEILTLTGDGWLNIIEQADRQRLYETLHRQYGCRIY